MVYGYTIMPSVSWVLNIMLQFYFPFPWTAYTYLDVTVGNLTDKVNYV